jgi:hypothetical protein
MTHSVEPSLPHVGLLTMVELQAVLELHGACKIRMKAGFSTEKDSIKRGNRLLLHGSSFGPIAPRFVVLSSQTTATSPFAFTL